MLLGEVVAGMRFLCGFRIYIDCDVDCVLIMRHVRVIAGAATIGNPSLLGGTTAPLSPELHQPPAHTPSVLAGRTYKGEAIG